MWYTETNTCTHLIHTYIHLHTPPLNHLHHLMTSCDELTRTSHVLCVLTIEVESCSRSRCCCRTCMYVCIYVCMRMYVCMHVCVCVCTCSSINTTHESIHPQQYNRNLPITHVSWYAYMHAYIHLWSHRPDRFKFGTAITHVSWYAYIHTYIHAYIHEVWNSHYSRFMITGKCSCACTKACIWQYMYACMHVCMYVCMYVCIYIYIIYIYIYIYINHSRFLIRHARELCTIITATLLQARDALDKHVLSIPIWVCQHEVAVMQRAESVATPPARVHSEWVKEKSAWTIHTYPATTVHKFILHRMVTSPSWTYARACNSEARLLLIWQ